MVPVTRSLLILLGLIAALLPDESDLKRLSPKFWEKHGGIYNLPMMDDNGELLLQQTQYFVASSSLLPEHVADRHGSTYPHIHFKDDYASVPFANNYWDAKFESPRLTQRLSDATIRRNGTAYTLAQLSAGGTYDYWVDDNEGAMAKAMAAELGVQVSPNSPAAGMAQGKTGTPTQVSAVSSVAFKFGCSGVYQAQARAFDANNVRGQRVTEHQ